MLVFYRRSCQVVCALFDGCSGGCVMWAGGERRRELWLREGWSLRDSSGPGRASAPGPWSSCLHRHWIARRPAAVKRRGLRSSPTPSLRPGPWPGISTTIWCSWISPSPKVSTSSITLSKATCFKYVHDICKSLSFFDYDAVLLNFIV